MSRRLLLCGEPEALRRRLAAEIDAGFDVVLEQAADVLEAAKRLPEAGWDLFVVLADGERAPGLDLVRFLEGHALHQRVPVLFIGGDERQRKAALAAGAERALPAETEAGPLAEVVAELLDVA